jgi:hypothetical protein
MPRTAGLLSGPTPQVNAVQPTCLFDEFPQVARQGGASEPKTTQLAAKVRASAVVRGK